MIPCGAECFSQALHFFPVGLNLFRDFQIYMHIVCWKRLPDDPQSPVLVLRRYIFLFVSFLPSWTSDLDLLFNFLWTSDITIVVDLKLVIFHWYLYERFRGYSSSLFRCLSLLCLHLWCSVISWTLPFPHLPSAHINK